MTLATISNHSADAIFVSWPFGVKWGAIVLLMAALAACGGGGGGDIPPRVATPTSATSTLPSNIATRLRDPNVASVYIDGGPTTQGSPWIPNALYTDVKVCAPGDLSQCAVIKHVLVDTGSVGLRLIAQALPPALLAALPAVNFPRGAPTGECLAFISGVTWGGVRSADVRMGGSNFEGQLAAGISVQIIADPDSRLATVPAGCAAQGAMMQTTSTLGANGILGVGLFAHDCGSACASSARNVYFSCPSAGACVRSTMPLPQQVSNPIAAFSSDNNGNTIVVGNLLNGAAVRAEGQLVFGIATRQNNALAAGSAILATNSSGYFQSIFNGNMLAESFIDSGSSINFFPSSGNVFFPPCSAPSDDFYCAASSLTLTATNTGRNASASQASVLIVNATDAFNNNPDARALLGLAGSGQSASLFDSLDLGMSFFFGRSVATLIENRAAAGFPMAGPAFAHTP